jgi:hypothetical protein
LIITAAALALGACSADRDAVPDTRDNGHAVTFGEPQAAATRATITASLRKIGVFGYSHAGAFAADPSARFADYFLNRSVADLPGNGTWTYDGPRKYWPEGGTRLSFFAYAPFVDVEDTFALYPKRSTDPGAPRIVYTVPAAMFDQIDLLWGNRLDMTYADSNNGQVGLTMDHALTRIDFEVKLDEGERGRPFTVKVTGLEVRNVVGAGTLDLSKAPTDPGLWTTARPASDAGWAKYTMTPEGHGELADLTFDARNAAPAPGATDPWVWNNLFKPNQYLMLIPQALTAQGDGLTPAEVVLKYTGTNERGGAVENKEVTLPLGGTLIPVWKPGMGVTYQITVSVLNGVQIGFDIEGFVSGTPWVDQNGGDPVTGMVG